MYPLINVGFRNFFPKNNKRVYTTIRGTRVDILTRHVLRSTKQFTCRMILVFHWNDNSAKRPESF